jgi:hypothetical protein
VKGRGISGYRTQTGGYVPPAKDHFINVPSVDMLPKTMISRQNKFIKSVSRCTDFQTYKSCVNVIGQEPGQFSHYSV